MNDYFLGSSSGFAVVNLRLDWSTPESDFMTTSVDSRFVIETFILFHVRRLRVSCLPAMKGLQNHTCQENE